MIITNFIINRAWLKHVKEEFRKDAQAIFSAKTLINGYDKTRAGDKRVLEAISYLKQKKLIMGHPSKEQYTLLFWEGE